MDASLLDESNISSPGAAFYARTAVTPSTILHRRILKSVRESTRLFVAVIDLLLAFDSVDKTLMR